MVREAEATESDLLGSQEEDDIVFQSTYQPPSLLRRVFGGQYFLTVNNTTATLHLFVEPDGNATVLTHLKTALQAGPTGGGIDWKFVWDFVREKNVQFFLVHPGATPRIAELYSRNSFMSAAIVHNGTYRWIGKRELAKPGSKWYFDQADIDEFLL